MPLPRPLACSFLCLAAALAIGGCGGEEPDAAAETGTEDPVQAASERYEASEEFANNTLGGREPTESSSAEAASPEATDPEPASPAGDQAASVDAGADADALAAMERQASDLLGEIDAALRDGQLPQAQAALETLRSLPGDHAAAGEALAERIRAAEASLADARSQLEGSRNAASAIEAARRNAASIGGAGDAGGPEIGAEPGEPTQALEK